MLCFWRKKEIKRKIKKEDWRGTGDGNHTNYESRRKIKSVPYISDTNQYTCIAKEKTVILEDFQLIQLTSLLWSTFV
jgi:hypothetical protein